MFTIPTPLLLLTHLLHSDHYLVLSWGTWPPNYQPATWSVLVPQTEPDPIVTPEQSPSALLPYFLTPYSLGICRNHLTIEIDQKPPLHQSPPRHKTKSPSASELKDPSHRRCATTQAGRSSQMDFYSVGRVRCVELERESHPAIAEAESPHAKWRDERWPWLTQWKVR